MTRQRIFIAGETPKSLARAAARIAANRPYRRARLNGWQMAAAQRLKELGRIGRLRLRAGAAMGAETAWIECIANAVRVRYGQVRPDDVRDEAARLGLGAFRSDLIDATAAHVGRAAWGRYELFPARVAGDKLQLTADERRKARVRFIEAVDESADDRRRLRERERKAEKRAAAAALAPRKMKKVEMAKALGVSRPTLDAWIEKGIFNPETGELVDFTKSVRSPLYLRYGRRTKNVKSGK